MNCADAAERITALVDGELPLEERVPLERHLADCAACREARAAEEAIAARVRAIGRPPLPDGFREAVLERVRAEPAAGGAAPRGRLIPLGPWLAAGTAAAAAALAMVYFGGGDRAGAPVASAPAEKRALALDDATDRERGADLGGKEDSFDKGPRTADGAVKVLREDARPARPDQTGSAAVPPVEVPAPETAPDSRTPAPAAGPPPAPKAPAPPPAARRSESPAGGGGEGKDMDGARPGGSGAPPADAAKEKRSNEGGRAEPAAEAEEARKTAPEESDARARAKSEEIEKQEKAAEGDREVRRLALFFRAPGGPSAERDIDRVLLAHRELALETVGWKDASTLETASGRALRSFTATRDREAGGFAQMETAKAPVGRVIQVRLRARDLDRVREALGKAESVREAGSLLLLDLESRDLGEVELGALAALADPPAPDGGAKPGAAAAAPAAGGTPAPMPAPAEPAPPPPPSGKALERLAKGVEPAPRPVTDGAKGDAETEVWLEIHLLGEPLPR